MGAERCVYALTGFTVERREAGWYFARSAMRHGAGDWRGPYRSEASVAMMIARPLRREIAERYGRQVNGGAPP